MAVWPLETLIPLEERSHGLAEKFHKGHMTYCDISCALDYMFYNIRSPDMGGYGGYGRIQRDTAGYGGYNGLQRATAGYSGGIQRDTVGAYSVIP